MNKKIFDERLTKIMGVKDGDVKNTHIGKVIGDGTRVLLEIKPSPKQLLKLRELLFEEFDSSRGD